MKEAEKLEKEIMHTKTDNVHLREERGQADIEEEDETGLYDRNEEMKYSGVVRELVEVEPPRKRFTCRNTKIVKDF